MYYEILQKIESSGSKQDDLTELQAAGWDGEPHSIAEQRTITDGRVVPVGKGFIRKPMDIAEFLEKVDSYLTEDFNSGFSNVRH